MMDQLLAEIRKLYDSILENPHARLESMANRIPDLLGIISALERENKELKARQGRPITITTPLPQVTCFGGSHAWIYYDRDGPAEGTPCLCGEARWQGYQTQS